ncbi:hypothetical protein A2434_00440 [Candidatus Woesebacteria bacterium RIFOXYC1_FULL_41_14]|uniref:Endolytic murein transglycosylase n=2 Tax=Candidatus Woeseibacteriota TaxID=1752722 RepID=A0A0G0U9K5_9BACT|nr:MAG: YceG family protein [Candidatus Woesebacteria bacterium GW2011_GWF1_40_24]OGM83845.1 MAG: hypothetical protein A2434_00440 [Candidatus Woesebacteria bacterium RIFOXYC1_FULL_41_14]OGM87778.1 MAG: hypothetical protein A2594_02755 [Candidatus Woesebacteria bacterium RIFOXYD1_FULL_41_28]
MKRLLLIPFVLALVVVAVASWFYKNSGPVSESEKLEYFIIAKGASASQIGNKLESAGLIKSALAFKLYVQFTGQSGKLQTGEFRLTPSHSLFQTVDSLFKGPIELWVTIPEGLRREEIAQKIAASLDKDNSFIVDFLQASEGEEGYLFPDTYLFPRDVAAPTVVKRMTDTFDSKTEDLENRSGLSFEKAIVLASIIERETKTDQERPVVSGILIKRLNSGWPLQTDAAVQYAVGTSKEWWPILTLDNLSAGSPYNTYKYQGLPPTPIASPGLSSIRGVLNPTESEYWYYIHDTKGQIHYAETLEEHNANIARYLGK